VAFKSNRYFNTCSAVQHSQQHVLHSTALHSTALHCTVLYCTVLHCDALYCIALHCTVMHCTVLCLALLPFVSSLSIAKYVCNQLRMFLTFILCLISCFCFCLGILCSGIVLCIDSPFVYSCLSPTFVQFYRPLPIGANAISVNSIIA
jgi:hypothetical protein